MNRHCPSEKIKYRTRGEAKKALRQIRQEGGNVREAYDCHQCEGWHLTSQGQTTYPCLRCNSAPEGCEHCGYTGRIYPVKHYG